MDLGTVSEKRDGQRGVKTPLEFVYTHEGAGVERPHQPRRQLQEGTSRQNLAVGSIARDGGISPSSMGS